MKKTSFDRAIERAAEWGHSVLFWVRSGDAFEAGRRAKLAVRAAQRACAYSPVLFADHLRKIAKKASA